MVTTLLWDSKLNIKYSYNGTMGHDRNEMQYTGI